MRTLFFALAFCFSIVSSAQLFGPQNILTTNAGEISAIDYGDIDGDGDRDIVSISEEDDVIMWFENIDGEFGNSHIINEGDNRARSLVLIDIDFDGDRDLITASSYDAKLLWYENDGSGNFLVVHIIDDNVEGATSVIVADLDDDNDLDIALGSADDPDFMLASEDGIISYYTNDGDENFSSAQIIDNNFFGVPELQAIDMNDDDLLDLFVASKDPQSQYVFWYSNWGNGFFSDSNQISLFADGITVAVPVDIDGDNDLDIVTGSGNDGNLMWFENQGGLDFYPYNYTILNSESGWPASIELRDIGWDGDMDLLVSHRAWNGGKVTIYENDGDGVFDADVIIESNDDWSFASFTNLGGSGASDILISTDNHGTISWIEDEGSGNYATVHSVSPHVDSPECVYSADLDGDGDQDIISASSNDNKIAWIENTGGGNFALIKTITTNALEASSVYAADFDNDGDIDVASASFEGDDIEWYANDGLGNFSGGITIESYMNGATSVHGADIDGDGDTDILATGQYSDRVRTYENDGSGNFTLLETVSGNADGAQSVYTSDLDNDGDLDVLSASLYDDKIAWYENDGTGNFSSEIILSENAMDARAVYAADLDLDGDIDVLSASETDDKIAWYENYGMGYFSTEKILSSNINGAYDVSAADLDLDGDIDIVASGAGSGENPEIFWFENNGGGNFSSENVVSSFAFRAKEIHLSDLDNDGDLDLISGDSFLDHVAWYENKNGEGCTDPDACNYNENVLIDNGSCCYDNCGCTDTNAENYDPEAICPASESCQYIEGCADPIAENYNPEVTLDDGSCEYIEGCSYVSATNYDEAVTLDDGTCMFEFTGLVFNDINENAIFDDQDYGLAFQTISISPLGIEIITNDAGEFTFEYEGIEPLFFFLEQDPMFPYYISDHPFFFNPEVAYDTYVSFGISSEAPDFEICIDLYPSGNGFLCNDWSNHNICYRNTGNVPIDGIVEVEYDPLFQDHAEATPIDSTNGNIVYMSFENLLPGEMFFYDIELLTPTVDHIGEYVTSYARVTGFYEGEQVAFGEEIREMAITCAYDPNDKQAFPLGYTDEHWLLQETEQEFLIRFQNTGNAPAQNIRIQDTLDVNFDIESFKLVANSHSVMTTIDPETRLIDFYFEDIQLPDSVNNEPDSHGLVSYKITPLPDLPVQTVLENTAYIYFDNNDPIITNTTWTTIHECGGESVFESNALIICDEPQVNFQSTYEFLEEYSWQLDGMVVGMEPEFLLASIESPDYDVTLIASNPLCTESTTIAYEVIDIELLDPCLADFTCDGMRNSEDLLSFLTDFGCQINCGKDLDGNGTVDATDLLVFLSFFGNDCWE